MSWTLLKTEAHYQAALERLDEIFQPCSEAEQDEFDLLVLLINNYETTHHPIPDADPVQVIKMKMAYMELQQKDLVKYIGSKSTVSKILSYKSPLTLRHIWILSKLLDLPVELLARPYRIDQRDFMKKIDDLTPIGA